MSPQYVYNTLARTDSQHAQQPKLVNKTQRAFEDQMNSWAICKALCGVSECNYEGKRYINKTYA